MARKVNKPIGISGGNAGDCNDGGNDDCDYEVGYKKPPKSGQFKPGQSGNPRGPEKGSRGLKTDLHKELTARSSIKINGKEIKGTKQQLMVMALTARAAAGDIKAAALLLPIIQQVLGVEDRGTGKAKLSASDQALFDELMAEVQNDDPSLEAAADADGNGNGEGGGRTTPPADSAEDPEEPEDGEPNDG